MGPSGVTLVIIREDLLPARARRPGDDARLSHARQRQKSLHNTPNTWGIYIINLGHEVAERKRRPGSDAARE